MMPFFSQSKIETRILTSLLMLTFVALISSALISFIGMKNLGTYATELNEGLGQEALRVSKNAMQNLARDGILRIIIDQANLFDAEFKGVETTVNLLAALAENSHNTLEISSNQPASSGNALLSQNMVDLFKSVLSNNIFISDFTVSTSDGRTSLFAMDGRPSLLFDARKLEWYSRAVTSKKLGWSNPYLNPVTNKPFINCSKPVYDKRQRLVSVIGSEIALESIKQRIIRIQLNNQGVAILLDQSRKVIAKAGVATEGITQKAEYFHLDDEGEERRRLDEALLAGKNGISRGFYQKQECFVAYAPVATTKWSVLLILPVEDVNAPIRPTERSISTQLSTVKMQVDTKITLSLVILAFCFFVMLGLVLVVASRVAKDITAPILELENGVLIIGEGNLDYRLDVNSGDEVEKLADSFNKMTTDLQSYVRNLTEATAAKERIQSELKVATDIQASLLPRIFPAFPTRAEFDIFASMDPAKEVGGDFYDFFFVDDNNLCFLIADVADKGVPAALYMMVAKTLLKSEAQRLGEPDQILSYVNNVLAEGNDNCMFVTVFCAILDTRSGEVRFANAGHNPPLIIGSRETRYLTLKAGFVLGPIPDSDYETEKITLQPGDTLFLYTDGVTEAKNPEAELYGEPRLLNALQSGPREELTDMIHHIRAEVIQHANGAPQSDDITMLALRYIGRNSRTE
ncbi:MAG: SpoIIE family protein phosphatase [Desulfuromonadales bacterium]